MKGFLVLAILVAVVSPVWASTPEEAVPWELLAGGVGSAIGWAGGFLAGRALAGGLGLESQPDQKDLVTLASVAIAVTAGTSLAVIGVGSWLGVDGNNLACVGGTLLGMVAGMIVEPLLGRLLRALLPAGAPSLEAVGRVVEGIGFASMVLMPAIGATVSFNIGATER